jgi:hypothetical protein
MWARVRWTEARQVAGLLEWPEESLGDASAARPEVFFERLRAEGRLQEAAQFLGQALSRYEAVAWAAISVKNLCPAEAKAQPLESALAWVKDPIEDNRRAAFTAANAAPTTNPARLAALAVFFSGGSMSPDGQAPVPAPRESAGKLAAGAVLAAAVQSGDHVGGLGKALTAGAAIAERGVSAADLAAA